MADKDDDGQSAERSVVIPSGAVIRGRRMTDIPTSPAHFLLALADGPLPAWPHRRIAWPDFWIPTNRTDALAALTETLRRARDGQLVEVACHGGRGRTGTALAALAVLDGMPARDAVAWVRRTYHPGAVETPWQAAWVRRLPPGPPR